MMKVFRGLEGLRRDPNSVVTVGSFDGVHLAHREIIREVVHRARMSEGRSVVITFDPHPSVVVRKSQGPVSLLTTLGERIELIGSLQVDVLCVLEFTPAFSRLSPREFYGSVIVDGIGVSEVVVGYDHMFGHDRGAGVHELISMGKEFNFSVFTAHPVKVDGITLGSTVIRNLLLEGDVEKAASLLGYQYRFRGTVVRGDNRGKTIGFPTANIRPTDQGKVIPGRGVYLVGVKRAGVDLFGMMNIGSRPTFTDGTVQGIEVHIFGVKDDIYGEELNLTMLRRLRDEQKFATTEDLVLQLHRDQEESMRMINEFKNRAS
jgi:riboflavin kinase/FMN adenylyltransferase